MTNVTKLYDVTSTLPAYQPDPTTIRVLHVSDIHLNPASWKIIASLVEQYEIDVIVDSGDTMDHGTAAENGFLDPIADLGAPYVWVRGNHDSLDHPALPRNASRTCTSWTTAGPSRSRACASRASATRSSPPTARSSRAATRREQLAGAPPGLRAARPAGGGHARSTSPSPTNRTAARETDGEVPLVLAGHLHHQEMEVMKGGTRLRIEGSTGGSGLRALEGEYPDPIEASVLYLDRDTRRLQAWDEIKLGGLGLTTAEVSRHLPEENQPGAGQPPTRRPRPAVRDTRLAQPLREHPVNRFGDTSRHPICFSRPRRAAKRPGGPIALIV